jgi:hypothetical protein
MTQKSIRDRDLLRQQILESKGWSILRIWSTDWFKNRDSEITALLGKLDELLAEQRQIVGDIIEESKTTQPPCEPTLREGEPVARPAETDETVEEALSSATDEEEALRQALLEYRRIKIEPSSQRLERSILSDPLLEEFLKRRPIDREEFLQFPFDLRNAIDPSEGALLDEILGIIEAYAE